MKEEGLSKNTLLCRPSTFYIRKECENIYFSNLLTFRELYWLYLCGFSYGSRPALYAAPQDGAQSIFIIVLLVPFTLYLISLPFSVNNYSCNAHEEEASRISLKDWPPLNEIQISPIGIRLSEEKDYFKSNERVALRLYYLVEINILVVPY